MKMSDKDLDQLFNAKLADMEMEPSANVWANITNELDGVKAEKKGGIPFMRIAASIVVIMGVSLFFIRPKTTTVELHQSASQVADVNSGSSRTSPVTLQPTVDPVVEEQPITTESLVRRRVNQTAAVTRVNATPMSAEVDTTANTIRLASTTQQVNNNNTPIIAQVQTPAVQNTGTKSNVDASTNIKADPSKKLNNDRVLASLTAKTPEPAKKKRGIHSLGDLLNVVIAKVDKRDDKLIEFTNTSDDDSFNVTGLNLGLLHAKKDN